MPPDPDDVTTALERQVDPVADSDAYREMLLGLLGDRDPAEVQGRLVDEVQALVESAGPHLRTRPAPGEWSAVEVLAHILDAEIVTAGRYRWILAHDQPTLIGYDQDLWVERIHDRDESPDEMLALLRELRTSHLRLWGRTSQEERARFGVHTERGQESFELTFRLIAGHDRFHLGQMRRTLAHVME